MQHWNVPTFAISLARSAAHLGKLHVQNSTPLFALQELGGWESAEMVRRYAHLAADHLAPYAERLCAVRALDFETVARFGHSPENSKGLPSASP